ncbi:hypothetical protein AGDE_12551 [Angomonas deanei]|uniref:Uncharacterized protein n=1 Tax=Angomonas deanei TaxID=59799 RepID=A0A7G2CE10_9TRYP|nr:hypothetical protein AGDE_12551 [Angomonas deanei]CAD2217197.1 hypothetical protein, conserved [Angomonas deanei]|eukprot:EPY24044.1 hypothetical protein AGDE_12551 [Angomonas deanei]
MRKALTRTQSTYFGHQAGMVSVTGVPSSTTSSSQSPSLPTTINMGVMLPGRSPMSMSGGQMQFSPSPPVERYPSSHGSNGRHYRSAPPVLIAVEEGKSSEDISIKRIRKHK